MNLLLMTLLLAPGDGPTIDGVIADRAGGPVAPAADDAEFLRRVLLDLHGRIPAADEVRAFLKDTDPGKRDRLIDRLLDEPGYARRMEEAFTVMLLERRGGSTVSDQAWHAYLRKAFAEDRPWDRIVGELLTADGRDKETRPALKFFVDGRRDVNQMTRDVGRLFLGKDLQCAQCHRHPSVREWRQSEYMGLHAYLHLAKVQTDGKTKKVYLLDQPGEGRIEYASVFKPQVMKDTGPIVTGMEKEAEVPTIKKGEEWEVKPVRGGMPGVAKFRPRALLARDLAAAGNRQFARNAVNRIWFLMMGRGLVHPLDMDHSKNPPSHPVLLEALTDRFLADGLSVKKLVRRIVRSDAYRRSSLLPGGKVKPESYRAAIPKPLSAEQMSRAVLSATGVKPTASSGKFNLKGYLSGTSTEPPRSEEEIRGLFVRIFGNPAGEPEVDFSPGMSHALFLRNERALLRWLEPRDGNLTERLLRMKDPGRIAGELYLNVLSRFPVKEETAEVKGYLARRENRAEALADLVWALIASAEFRFNH